MAVLTLSRLFLINLGIWSLMRDVQDDAHDPAGFASFVDSRECYKVEMCDQLISLDFTSRREHKRFYL